MLDFDGDVHAGGQVEFLKLINGLCGGFDDINEALVGALLEGFLGLLVGVGGALDGKSLDAGWKRDGPRDARPVRLTVSAMSRADWSMTRWSKAFSLIRMRCPAIQRTIVYKWFQLMLRLPLRGNGGRNIAKLRGAQQLFKIILNWRSGGGFAFGHEDAGDDPAEQARSGTAPWNRRPGPWTGSGWRWRSRTFLPGALRR